MNWLNLNMKETFKLYNIYMGMLQKFVDKPLSSVTMCQAATLRNIYSNICGCVLAPRHSGLCFTQHKTVGVIK